MRVYDNCLCLQIDACLGDRCNPMPHNFICLPFCMNDDVLPVQLFQVFLITSQTFRVKKEKRGNQTKIAGTHCKMKIREENTQESTDSQIDTQAGLSYKLVFSSSMVSSVAASSAIPQQLSSIILDP